MSSIIDLGIFKKSGLPVAIMLGLMLCSSMVHAGLTVAPDFTVADLNGNAFTLSGNRGKVVLIDFFATWCTYCINEIAELKTVYNHFGSSIVLISVDVDDTETGPEISDFASVNGITWTVAGGGSGVYAAYESLALRLSGVAQGIPLLSTVDQNDYIRFNHAGDPGSSASNLISEIEQLQAPFGVTLTMDSARAVVGRGLPLLFDLTLENRGSFTETFNTTAYANTITVYTKQVPLTSGNSTTITFVWDTTGFAYGNYTMSACATPVSGETNTTDDTVFGGRVVITIPGDLNGDFNVGLKDLVILADAYGSRPGDSKWNINADIDGNGAAGLSDLVVLAQHYGQHYP